ncbi:tyrosine-protein phosphatase [Rhizobium lusitanum]|jgi:protein tyrosine/serine phosphatase|uniref:tyrosine-protein phosphatase n=1 Tax=Rhizobium lusitanum TaxID=293958 RepID=UPI0015727815|nr:tyrosine-protein phosphatase [Rhizobium lusitanum]NTJ10374.1 dual specificity protein phosphatase family protein [Rhizobium lusitanum]
MIKLLKTSIWIASISMVLLGSHLSAIQLTDNFDEVVPGQLYRSAQPSQADIDNYVKHYGIRTMINLRGRSDALWYKDEIGASQHAGISHIDFALPPFKEVTPAQASRLVAIMRDSPKPILVHCETGADPTGLVSAIYLQQIAGVDEKKAEGQLSILYGHLGIPYLSSTYAMDESWEQLEKRFGLKS